MNTWEEPTCTEARRRNEPQQHAAWRALAVLRTVVCGWWFCLWVCRAVGPGPLLLAVPGPAVWCVLGGVLLSRTLAGAVPSALSGLASGFGMGAGRFPVAVTTETTVRAVRGPLSVVVVRVIRLSGCLGCPLTTRCVCVVGLGVDRIVDALTLTVLAHPHARTLGVRWCVLWGCCCLCWPISTSQLSQPLPVFHSWPINPVVCWGPTRKDKSFLRRPYLEDGFPLRCFQRLPFPNVANQPCPGRDNWHTRGSSVPVLSY